MDDITFGTSNPLKDLFKNQATAQGVPPLPPSVTSDQSDPDAPHFGADIGHQPVTPRLDPSPSRPSVVPVPLVSVAPEIDTLEFSFGPGKFRPPSALRRPQKEAPAGVVVSTPRLGPVPEIPVRPGAPVKVATTPRTHVIATPRNLEEAPVATPRPAFVMPEIRLGVPGERGKALYFLEAGEELVLVVDRSEQQERKKRNIRLLVVVSAVVLVGGVIVCVLMFSA